MIATEIARWKTEGKNYKRAVELYQKYGQNTLILTLIKTPETTFTKQKLYQDLENILATESPNAEVVDFVEQVYQKPVVYPKNGVDPAITLPTNLIKKQEEIKELYKQSLELRRRIHNLIPTIDRQPITLQQCFQIMEQQDQQGSPIPFTLTWVTYNEETGAGGKVHKSLCITRFNQKGKFRFAVGKKMIKKNRTNPLHSQHGTVNVQLVNSLEYRKIHTWLIFQINNTPVTLGNNG